MKKITNSTRHIFGSGARMLVFSSLLLASSCTEDKFMGQAFHGDGIRFTAVVDNSWNAAKTPRSADTRSSGGKRHIDTYPLAGEKDPKTYYMHVAVSDGIEGTALGGSAPVTRGKPINNQEEMGTTYNSFSIYGYSYDDTGDFQGSTPEFINNEVVSWDKTTKTWSFADEKRFPATGKVRFIAMAPNNLTSDVLKTTSTTGGLEFEYTLPKKTEQQKDLLLAQSDEIDCSGKPSAVNLVFRHLLAAVKFTVADDIRKGTIKSVSLKGIPGKGTYTSGNDQWSFGSMADNSETFTLELGDGGVEVPVDSVMTEEQTFMVLPTTYQNSGNITPAIEVVFDDSFYGERTITHELAGTEWRAGKTYIYKISTSEIEEEFVFDVNLSKDVTVSEDGDISTLYSGGMIPFEVTSYSVQSSGSQSKDIDQPWSAEFSYDRQQWYSWKDFQTAYERLNHDSEGTDVTLESSTTDWNVARIFGDNPTFVSGNGSTTAESVPFTVAGQIRYTKNHDKIIQNNGIKGSEDNYIDLSLINPVTREEMSSANSSNCYIVDAKGYYKLPLVYGNGLQNGQVVDLTKFGLWGADGKILRDGGINSYWKNKGPHGTYNSNTYPADYTPAVHISGAKVIWQDEQGMISDLEFENLPDVGGGSAKAYLKFKVGAKFAPSEMKQFNAIIAIMGNFDKTDAAPNPDPAGDVVVWSWHIWCTDIGTHGRYFLGNKELTGERYEVLSKDLGAVEGVHDHYPHRSIWVRFKQTNSDKYSEKVYRIYQMESNITKSIRIPSYQFGRKDPICPNNDDAFLNVGSTELNETLYDEGGIVVPFTTFDESNQPDDYCRKNRIQYPGQFALGETSRSGNEWKYGEADKTPYDPCPYGFAVIDQKAINFIIIPGTGDLWGSLHPGMMKSGYVLGRWEDGQDDDNKPNGHIKGVYLMVQNEEGHDIELFSPATGRRSCLVGDRGNGNFVQAIFGDELYFATRDVDNNSFVYMLNLVDKEENILVDTYLDRRNYAMTVRPVSEKPVSTPSR